MSEKILGIDLGPDFLVSVVIEHSFKGTRLLEICRITMDDIRESDNLTAEGEPERSFFENALALMNTKMDLNGCFTVALSLSPRLCSFRNLFVPFYSGNKIRQILDFELAVHLPLNNANYLSDFVMLGPFHGRDKNERKSFFEKKIDEFLNKKRKRDKNFLFTISVPGDDVDNVFTSLGGRGYQFDMITSGGYASAVLFLARKKEVEDAVFLDSGEGYTFICLIFRGRIVSARSLGIQKTVNLLVVTIYQFVQGFRFRYGVDFNPEHCYVLPSCRAHQEFEKNLEREMAGKLSCTVISVKPADYIEISEGVGNAVSKAGHGYLNAVAPALIAGESLSAINLCRGPYARDAFWEKNGRYIVSSTLFFLVMSAAFIFNILTDSSILEKKIARLDNAANAIYRESFPGAAVIVDPLMQMKINVREAEKKYQSVTGSRNAAGGSRAPAIEILYAISASMPEGVQVEITRLFLSNDRVVISGSTNEFNNVDRIKTGLERSRRFQEVKITSAASAENGTRVRFNFALDLP